MFMERIIGVFKLDVATFEAIEADESATSQAAIIVLVIALISGLGSALGASFIQASFLGLFASSFFATIIGWLVWSAVTYFVGTSFFWRQSGHGADVTRPGLCLCAADPEYHPLYRLAYRLHLVADSCFYSSAPGTGS